MGSDQGNRNARQANAAFYGASEAYSYMAAPYHRVRLSVARGRVAVRAQEYRGSEFRVLEIGPGSADGLEATRESLPEGVAVVGCDLTAVRELSGSRAVAADAGTGLPFRSGSFSAVLMSDLIEHVFFPVQLLRECGRVLNGDGLLVVTTPNLAAIQDRLWFLLGRTPRQVDCVHPYLRWHIRPFTAESLVRTLHLAGFDDVQLSSNLVVWRRGGDIVGSSRALARLFPRLGGSLIAAATWHRA